MDFELPEDIELYDDDEEHTDLHTVTNTNQRIDQYDLEHQLSKRLSLWDDISLAADHLDDEVDAEEKELQRQQVPIIHSHYIINKEKQDEDAAREAWTTKDIVSVYSRGKDTWFEGTIERIEGTKKHNEWLIVRYGKTMQKTKKIQRACSDIKPIPANHPIFIKQGSNCSIYSYDTDTWCKGEVTSIYHDKDGEWLKVKYKEDGKWKVCDIQRYSDDIELVVSLD
eukprot:546879_1